MSTTGAQGGGHPTADNTMSHSQHQPYHERSLTLVEAAVEGEWSAGEKLLKDLSTNEGVHGFRPEVRVGAAQCEQPRSTLAPRLYVTDLPQIRRPSLVPPIIVASPAKPHTSGSMPSAPASQGSIGMVGSGMPPCGVCRSLQLYVLVSR